MPLKLTYTLKGVVDETLETQVDAADAPVVTHDQFKANAEVDNNTVATPVTKVYADDIALVAGALTLDLEALAATNGGTNNMNGLKLQFIFIKNKTGNNDMVITPGAANGYNLFGGASDRITLKDGCSCAFWMNDQLDNVAAADSEIDISGTGTQSLEIMLVFG